ncbi:MAG: ABC transporter ATP-binding protein/permease [Humibacillus sp.]|nr:ABC transporter ATP-binding protein/permease [Humibacillus sp.]MDN5777162.1 ABC transporter ATP-binding protein/permease [Humibacillus sp.]
MADEPVHGSMRPDGKPARRAPVRELWPYLRPHAGVLGIVAVISLVGAGVTLAPPALVSKVVSAVGDARPLTGLVVLLVALVIVGALVSGVQQYLLQRTAEAVVRATRHELVGRLLRLPIVQYDTRRIGDLVSRVGSDTTLLRSVVTSGLVEGLAGAVVFVGAIVAMALIDPLLLGLTLLVVLLATLVVVTLGGRIQKLALVAQTQVGVLAAGVARALPAIRTIRAARATDREVAALRSLADDTYVTGVRLARVMALIEPVIGVALQGAFILVLAVGGYRVASGSLTVANLIAFILYLFLMVRPLGSVFSAYTSVQNALGAVIRIREITDLPEEDAGPAPASVSGRQPARMPLPRAVPLVEFDRVSFGYGSTRVLEDVSFAVPAGTRTAVVGPSGAGKTTLLSLLARFYDPSSGVIRLAGVDVAELGREQVRSWLGYVEQDAPVLAGTIRENLMLGAPDASDEQCEHVLDQVRLTGILHRDPLGLAAQVGEDGILLSGGERQRLAIARALLASPRLLLLDEPTSSLDSRNEVALRDAVDAVAGERTLVIVAHRLATVADADQIVVVEAGRVQAVGRHAELLETSPLYRELADHQLLV